MEWASAINGLAARAGSARKGSKPARRGNAERAGAGRPHQRPGRDEIGEIERRDRLRFRVLHDVIGERFIGETKRAAQRILDQRLGESAGEVFASCGHEVAQREVEWHYGQQV